MALSSFLSSPSRGACMHMLERWHIFLVGVLPVAMDRAPAERRAQLWCVAVEAAAKLRLGCICRQLDAWALDWSAIVLSKNEGMLSTDEVRPLAHSATPCAHNVAEYPGA